MATDVGVSTCGLLAGALVLGCGAAQSMSGGSGSGPGSASQAETSAGSGGSSTGSVDTEGSGPTRGGGESGTEPPATEPPIIEDMGLHEIGLGETFVFEPEIVGEVAVCRKDLGHDDVRVDSETGRITWDTSGLGFGRGFHVRIKCSNYAGDAYASMVVHVDNTGTSRLRVAGEDGVPPYLRDAGLTMSGGDTVVFPDGIYPISVTENESYENAFKETTPTAGTPAQFSTLIARSPGGVEVSGEPHDGIPTQKNGFQLVGPEYVALVGFVSRDALRASFMATTSSRVLLDFMGTEGTGTEGLPCSNFTEAAEGECSQAGLRVNGGQPLIQSSYDWGHNRYGIMTRSTDASVTRRSFVRLDEHRGDQPYGGFSDYCDAAHVSQDNTVFDSLAVAAPHYKNYAGLSAFPATGCENMPATLATLGLLAVNNDLSLSLMDQQAGPPHVWDHIVSYDSEGTCTPQTGLCGAWLVQSDKPVRIENSFFGRARGFQGGSRGAAFFDNVELGDQVVLADVSGRSDVGVPPRYLPESLLYYRGRSDTFHGDPGYDEETAARRWPIGGEDIIARNMGAYRSLDALAVGGGSVEVRGDRGATASGESMSEYFWAYLDPLIPPLVVRVKDISEGHRVAWEHLGSDRRTDVVGWQVSCMEAGETRLAELPESQLVYVDDSDCTAYAVRAVYSAGLSGIAYIEALQ